MRNHIAVKFLAILLCAASLLGTMGSILAIAVLTHLNLYNQSVDQMVDRRLKDNCQLYGNHLALGYASQTLGGCSEDMALERWPMVNINVRDASASLGYTLYDPEGQVLDSQNQALKESASVYTAQIGGQYMYLLSEKAENETLEETQPDEVQWDFTLENGESVYDAIPEEGAEVAAFLITYVNTAQGSVSLASTGAVGFAFRNSQGQVLCWFQENLALESGPVLQVVLQNTRGETVYQAAGESAVGELARGTNGGMIFTALSPVDQGVPEETGVPGDQMCLEETGAAVPESAEPAEETAPPTAPEGLQTQEVFVARFDDQEGNPVWEHSSPEAIGYVYLDETGCPAFVSYLPQEELPQDWLLPTTVNGVTLWNKDGERICELYAEGGTGTVYIGENGISAINTSSVIMNMLTQLAIGVTVGGNILVSRYFGSGDHEARRKAAGNTFTIGICAGLLFTALVVLLCRPILVLLQSPAMEDSTAYLSICGTGIFFIFCYNALSAILRGVGNSRIPLYCIITSVSLNVVLDILFVAVFHMGVAGAALATVIGQGVSFVTALAFCLVHREDLGLLPRYLTPEKQIVSRTLKLGLPVALQWTIASVSWLVVLTLVNKYGVEVSAGNGASNKIRDFCQLFLSDLTTGAGTMCAQCLGAGLYDRAEQVMKTCMKLALGMAAVIIVLAEVLAPWLVMIFTPDPEVQASSSTASWYVWCWR